MSNIYKLSFIFLFVSVLCLFSGGAILAETAPQIQTNSATNIQNNSATLNANLTYLGNYGSATVYFQWGANNSYDYQTSNITQSYVGSFSQIISGLSSNNTYHFRAVAQNSYGTVYGQDITFYTNQSNNGNTLTVNAGPDLYLTSNQTSTLQGSGYDPNGYSVNYYWTCNGGTLSSYNIAQPVYTVPYTNNYNNQTTYTCTLTVTNSYGGSNSDSMIVYMNGNNNNGNGNCTYHAYKLCVGSNIYWYDSCGTQQDLYYSCVNGQTCNNPSQYGQCTTYVAPVQPVNNYLAHYRTACYGGSLYWYDSLGSSTSLYKSCADNNSCTLDACSSGKCSNTIKCDGSTCAVDSADYTTYCPGTTTTVPGTTTTVPGTTTTVRGGYPTCGNGLCEPNLGETTTNCPNDCKLNTNIVTPANNCGNGLCEPNLGETTVNCPNDCKLNTNTVAPTNNCGNGLCEPNLGETTANCPTDCKISAASGLSILFFAKQDANSTQWQKTAQVGSNSQIYFMLSATNNSTAQIDNVNISANIPNEISSLGNLQLNNVPVPGDIISGINIGPIAPAGTRSITFEGKTQALLASATKPAIATSNVLGATQSDSVSINLIPSQVVAAVSSAPTTTGFWEFLKRWYLWILGALVLIFLFVIVFRRLSSNV